MAQTYFLIPTADGEAKLANAQALGVPLKITHMAVGDANGALPAPSRDRKTLINERRRAPLNSLTQDPANASQFIAEQVIPEDVGGWWIREAGLFDDTGTLIYYSNIPETYKPQLAEGSGRTQVVRLVCLVTSGATVELKVDPSIVLATRSYVDTQISAELDKRDGKQSVLVATTASLAALSGLLAVDGVALTAGARVLVKDQAAAKDNGIYLAAAGAWPRTSDADSGLDMTAGMLVPVEQGTTNGDSVWQLTTDGAIIVGATPLAFKRVGAGYFAPLNSPDFTGPVLLDTAAPGTNNRQAANTSFVTAAIAAAIANLVASAPGQLDTLNELATALGNDANFSATVFAQIAQRAMVGGSNAQTFSVAPATGPEHAARLSQIGHGQCRLYVVDAAHLKLSRFGGPGNIIINGVPRQIPEAGITIDNSGLTPDTLYYAFVYMNGANMALELQKGVTHSLDPATGVEIKTGDVTRTLAGMVYTTSASQFSDVNGARFLLNYFNRRNLFSYTSVPSAVNFTNPVTITEISTALRCRFLTWGDEATSGGCDGEMASSLAGSSVLVQCMVDGIWWGPICAAYEQSAGWGIPYSSHGVSQIGEGIHTGQFYGSVSGGGYGTLVTGLNAFLTRG